MNWYISYLQVLFTNYNEKVKCEYIIGILAKQK